MASKTQKNASRPKKAEMQTLYRPIGQVTPYPGNPRKNDAAVDAVARSIEQFGFRQPIVVDRQGVIIVGHTRYKAAIKLGLDEVPVHVADLDPVKASAYRLADNATNELSSWDQELLPIELQNLTAAGFNVAELGFAPGELEQYLKGGTSADAIDPNHVPDPPAKARTKRGDVWLLGSHRLMCGDSGNAQDVDKLLAGSTMHLAHMDPPYNVSHESRSNNALSGKLNAFKPKGKTIEKTNDRLRAKDRPIANDSLPADQYEQTLRGWFAQAARVLAPGRSFYFWGGYINTANYPAALAAAGLYFAQAIIWVKEHPVLGRKDFMGNHEWCFYGWKEGAAHKFFGTANIPDTWKLARGHAGEVAIGKGIRIETESGSRLDILPPQNARSIRRVPVKQELTIIGDCEPTDVWSIKKVPSQQMVHLTEKPVELAQRAIKYSTQRKENVLDLFGGSGSTLIACEIDDRRAFLMEMDPLYCDVIVQRWEQFTKRKATREK